MTTACRLFIHRPAEGAWNMAVDETLLDSLAHAPGELPSAALRFYQWTPATLSLGYFQPLDDRQFHVPSRGCPVVRRSSGGGALVHDLELTYSLVLAAGHPLAAAAVPLYHAVHEALIGALAEFSVAARMRGGAQPDAAQTANPEPANPESAGPAPDGAEPFLCFQREFSGDVVVEAGRDERAPAGRIKIAGSAQRRRRGAVLQHGSVLLRTSRSAPELRGIESACGVEISAESLIERWTHALARSLDLALVSSELDRHESSQAGRLAQQKYEDPAWIARR